MQNATLFPYCPELAQASLLIKLRQPREKGKQVNQALAGWALGQDDSCSGAQVAARSPGSGRGRREPGEHTDFQLRTEKPILPIFFS